MKLMTPLISNVIIEQRKEMSVYTSLSAFSMIIPFSAQD